MPGDAKQTIKARLAKARTEADQAAEAVRVRSQTRFDALMKMAPTDRLNALDDPDLIQGDRAKLRHSLEGSLSSAGQKAIRPGRPSWSGRVAMHRVGQALLPAVLSEPAIVAMVVGLPWLAVAWMNTAPIAVLTQSGLVAVTLPNGTTAYMSLRAGNAVRVYGRSGDDTVVGLWYEHAVDGRAKVPTAALRPR